jgi:pterin-4a-carbinolamine dehydratase
VPPLTADEASAHQRQTPEWSVEADARRIARTFKFRNFAEAFAFVHQAADLAEAEGHHPDISFGWGYERRRSKACTRMTSSWPQNSTALLRIVPRQAQANR